uniref:Heme transporter hrg-1 n=1 Tax=Parastrongyloides trichosuri TaxID=131310 RepID=A0A0N4ZWX5_PARTI
MNSQAIETSPQPEGMRWSMKIQLIWAIVGISAGLMAGPIFEVRYQNHAVLIIALASSVAASFLFFVHWSYYKKYLWKWDRKKIQFIIYLNAILCALCLIGCVACLIIAGINGETLSTEGLKGNNRWMMAVWLWMNFKWTMMIAIYTRKYSQKISGALLYSNPV